MTRTPSTIPTRILDRTPWWLNGLVGAASAVLGVLLVTRPFASLDVLVWLLAGGLLVSGAGRIAASHSDRPRGSLPVVTGSISILAAAIILLFPGLTIVALTIIVAVSLGVNGLTRAVGALYAPREDRLVDVLLGVSSLVLGALALAWPDVTVFVIAALFGVQVVLFGVEQVAAAIRRARASRTGETDVAQIAGTIETAQKYPVARTIGAVLALAATAGLLVVSLRLSGHPIPDAFYAAPADVPDAPGQLLRSEPFTADIPEGATGWRILYTTTRDEGVPAVASAIVVTPADEADDRPVIAWAHGTTGIAQGCAPSLLEHPFVAGAMPNLDEALDQGWAIVATDYIGLGTDGPHPYLIGQPSGRAVLDSVRAAQALGEARLGAATVVWGHSQGGHAVLWAGGLAASYAPELDLRGVAALAPAANLPALLGDFAESPAGTVLGSFLATSYAENYADVRLRDLVRPTARIAVDETSRRCLNDPATLVSVATALLGDRPVWNGSPAQGAVLERATTNVPTLPIAAPLLVAQGDADTLVTTTSQDAWVADRCAAGQQVDHRTYPGQDHLGLVTGDPPLLGDLITWTAQRFAGEPAPDTCP